MAKPKSKTALQKEIRAIKRDYKAVCQWYFQALDDNKKLESEVNYWKAEAVKALETLKAELTRQNIALKSEVEILNSQARTIHATRATRRTWQTRRRNP